METRPVKLDDLPLETLQQIAGHLDGTHRPSLYDFGLVSKACHAATSPSVFREIHLTVRNPKALQDDIDALVKALSCRVAARHVRSISVKGNLIVNIEEVDQGLLEYQYREINSCKKYGYFELYGSEKPVTGGWHGNHGPVEVSAAEDMAWSPFIDFVKTLPHLMRLVYDCDNQLPPSLLDALHRYHPQCKLHHLNFRFRSLLRDTPDPHEMAIATSSCLYRIKVKHFWRCTDFSDDFNQDSMLELVGGLAPNLKEVISVRMTPDLPPSGLRWSKGPWRGLPGFVPGKLGALTSLKLQGAVTLSPEFFQTWREHTDFSCLRHLTMGGAMFSEQGLNDEAMIWLTENCSFPNLRTLHVVLQRDPFHDHRTERPLADYVNRGAAFFRALEPLTELSVSGPLEPGIFDGIVSRHGCTLKKLSLCPTEKHPNLANQPRPIRIPMVFRKEHILQIQAQCPNLEDLAIRVERRKGDKAEVEMYRSFGKLERLQSLHLILDTAIRDVPLPDDPPLAEDDREYSNADSTPCYLERRQLREAFMRCAVDEALARSIWDTICRAKVGRKLDSLRLHTTECYNLEGDDSIRGFGEYMEHLSRSWLIKRSVRDDEENNTTIQEIAKQAREARDEFQRHLHFRRLEEGITEFSNFPAVHIFRRIWPPKPGSKDWRDDWASLPLWT